MKKFSICSDKKWKNLPKKKLKMLMIEQSKKSEKECCICMSTENELKNLKVKLLECPFCLALICKKCLKDYILTGTIEPSCPWHSCRKEFSPDILRAFFSKKFVDTDIRIKKETLFFSKELSLLPDTQKKVTVQLEYQKKYGKLDEEISTLTRQFREIQMRLHELKRQKNSLRWH